MKHLTNEQILEITGRGLTLSKKIKYGLHLLFCSSCREQVNAEKRFASKANRRLKRITSHAHPSKLMDSRVLAFIGQIAQEVVVKAPLMARWVFNMILVFALLSSSYGIFFYAPMVGSAHETPAEAYVSSKFLPVMAKTNEVIPDPNDYIKSESFLAVWCDNLMVCAPEYTRLIYLEGNSISDVFRASVLAHEAGVSTESVLPLVRNGNTWGQILSELNISFTSQLGLPESVSKSLSDTAQKIEELSTIQVTAFKHEDGHVSSPIPLTETEKENLPVGESYVEVDITSGQPTGNTEINKTPGLYVGVVERIGEGYSVFILKTKDNSFTVRLTNNTELLRYDDYLLPTQLTIGHICTVDGEWLDGELIATFLDAKEPPREIVSSGTVLYMDTESLTIAGFGSALYLDEKSIVTGKLEVDAKVEFTAVGNEIEGFVVKTLKSTPRPEPKPEPEAPKAEFTGVVVDVDQSEKLILLHDGSSIFYNRNTTFTDKMIPSVGQTITSTALSSNTLKDEKYQDQAIKVIVNSHPDLASKFEVAGIFTSHRCLNGCNWLKPEGVTEVELDNNKNEMFLIIPSTDGHSLITPSYKGMTIIMKGFVAGGVNLVTHVEIIDNRELQTRSGIVTEISEDKTSVTLDDGTIISIRPYTKNAEFINLGERFQFSCWLNSENNLTALSCKTQETRDITQMNSWLLVVAFDGEKLELADGTVIYLDEHTKITGALADIEIDRSVIKVGLKVLCDYSTTSDNKNIATLVKVFVNP